MGVFVVVAARLWRHTAQYVEAGGMLRSGLDTLMIAVGVLLLYWHLVVLPLRAPGASPVGIALACSFVLLAWVVAGSQVTRAWQRRDTGSWLLAAVTVGAVTGVLVWTVAKFGPDLRVWGVLLMIVCVLALPVAISHPAHRKLVVVQNVVERDRMGALAFLLGCWAVSYLTMLNRPLSLPVLVLALASLALIVARVFLVRSSEERLVERLQVLAFTDPLTGIGNRRALLTQLERGGEGWLITIDLDGFKEVNDRYGHDAGDSVLVGFVTRMKELLPGNTLLARIGGDEFAVLFNGDRAAALQLAETIVRQARDPHYARLTASVGLTWHGADSDPKHTVRDSDIAMQSAKRAGKDRLALLTGEMLDGRLRDLEIGARLSDSLDRVEVVYQPIVALSAGYPLVAVEALARWSDPVLGVVSPAEFVPIAERQGFIVEFGQVVLEKVLQQTALWLAEGRPRQVSLNVSWLQLRDGQAVEALSARLRREPELAAWVVLEVTETVFGEDSAAVTAVQSLRDLGVCIAVDDFGTGVSNLRRLRTLPVDVLKIDKSLLDGLGSDPAADAMLSMVNRLGESMGMTVLAEGIDDEQISRTLVELGVTLGQGFLYAHPMPAEQVPSPIPMLAPWLGRRNRVQQ